MKTRRKRSRGFADLLVRAERVVGPHGDPLALLALRLGRARPEDADARAWLAAEAARLDLRA